jgi:hypothetical protein
MRRLGEEVDDAATELRTVAHGLYPRTLARQGVAPRSASARASAGSDVRIDARAFGRHPAAVENAVFFSCLEAMENAAKHAGADAAVTVRLESHGEVVRFEVSDDARDSTARTSPPATVSTTSPIAWRRSGGRWPSTARQDVARESAASSPPESARRPSTRRWHIDEKDPFPSSNDHSLGGRRGSHG